MVGVGDLVQRIGDGRTGRVLGGRAIEWSGGAVCGLHRARGDEECRFLGWALKPRSTVCEWFGLKTTRTIFVGLASKPVVTVSSGLASKPVATVFSSLASKLVVMVSPDLGLKTGSSGLVIWASKSPRRFLGLVLKIKWASVCRLRHKTNGGRSAWDTRRDLATCFTWKQVWLGFPSLA
jgi:hypothetical protein